MFNIIIFLIGAGIMFYMAWRSWSRRRKLMTKGEKVEAAVQAPCRAGTAKPTCWSSPLLAAPTAPLPQVCQGQRACTGSCRHPLL